MPISTTSLTNRLKTELGTPTSSTIQDDVLGKIAKAIVDEIKANATVSVTVPGTGLSAPNGPVSGSATGTGTVS